MPRSTRTTSPTTRVVNRKNDRAATLARKNARRAKHTLQGRKVTR